MAIAALSPCVLKDTSTDEMIHCQKIAHLVQNLSQNTELKLQDYTHSPYSSYRMLIPYYEGNFTLNQYIATHIYACIRKMMVNEYVDLEGIGQAELPAGFYEEQTEIEEKFSAFLNYLKTKDSVVFVGKRNFGYSNGLAIRAEGKTFTLKVSTYAGIEKTDVLIPYLKQPEDINAIFSRESFCREYNAYIRCEIEEQGMNESEKQALFEKMGPVVAMYNLYEKNNNLSQLNTTSRAKRIVFEKTLGEKYYLSQDLESGGFEVFDKNYRHLGQYDFSGKQVKKAEPRNHKLLH